MARNTERPMAAAARVNTDEPRPPKAARQSGARARVRRESIRVISPPIGVESPLEWALAFICDERA